MWHTEPFLEDLTRRGLNHQTIDTYRRCVTQFVDWCESQDITTAKQVTDSLVQRYLETKIDTMPWTAGWRYVQKCNLKRYFRFLEQRHEILVSPMITIQKPSTLSGHYQAIDQQVLWSILDTYPTDSDQDLLVKCLLETGYSAALRPGEVRRMKIEDIDFSQKQLFIEDTKNHKDRIVPIGNVALGWIRRYIAEVRPKYVVNREDRQVFLGIRNHEPLKPHTINPFIQYRLRKHGFPRFSMHQLRVSAATHMVGNGMSIAYAQRLLGHAELRTTKTYVQLDLNRLTDTLAERHPRNTISLMMKEKNR